MYYINKLSSADIEMSVRDWIFHNAQEKFMKLSIGKSLKSNKWLLSLS